MDIRRWSLIALAAGAAACAGDTSPEPPAGVERAFPLRGRVVEVDSEARTVTVDHEPVDGYMEAMTMPFNVRDDWVLATAVADAQIRATLKVTGERSWLEDVVINRPPTAGAAANAVIPAPDPGAVVPAIELRTQDDQVISSASFLGTPWVFTFVYTRCPLPDFCPLMSEHMRDLYDAIEATPAEFADTRLVSISLDPEYDTPSILREYAVRYLGEQIPQGFARWTFAAPEHDSLHDLADFAGLRFAPDGDEVVHSLRTILVGADGRVVRTFVGNGWQAGELIEAARALSSNGD